MPTARKLAIAALIAVMYVLHQDVWFWHATRPLVFGVLPIGLFYHVCYTVAVAFGMALLVKWAWPADLEDR
jgi:hypothetical protein